MPPTEPRCHEHHGHVHECWSTHWPEASRPALATEPPATRIARIHRWLQGGPWIYDSDVEYARQFPDGVWPLVEAKLEKPMSPTEPGQEAEVLCGVTDLHECDHEWCRCFWCRVSRREPIPSTSDTQDIRGSEAPHE